MPLPGWSDAQGQASTAGRPEPPPHAQLARGLLRASAALGRRVAALLDSGTPVPGVTGCAILDELKTMAVCVRVDGKPVNPDAGDLDLTAGWGHAGKGGVTMPGRGRIERSEIGDQQSYQTSGLDIYLNSQTLWRNVPETVWGYTLGGYQVVKKWLSYREKPLLGRSLTREEVRHVTDTPVASNITTPKN